MTVWVGAERNLLVCELSRSIRRNTHTLGLGLLCTRIISAIIEDATSPYLNNLDHITPAVRVRANPTTESAGSTQWTHDCGDSDPDADAKSRA